MLLVGDEIGRSQQGNNNAYCQDNEISWIDWNLDKEKKELQRYVRRLIQIRKKHPVFCRRHFFQGEDIHGEGVNEIVWLSPDGREMTEKEWHQSFARCLGLFLAGDVIEEYDDRGRRVKDDNMILLLNAHHGEILFMLPKEPAYARWQVLVDTSFTDGTRSDNRFYHSNETYPLHARSLVLLIQLKSPRREGVGPWGCLRARPPGIRRRG